MNTGTEIARTGLLVKSGDTEPFEKMLTSALEASPFTEENSEGMKKHYKKYPSRYVDDLVKLRTTLPQYGGTQPINTTNNLILNLGELSLSQKQKLLDEKLSELGITKEMLEGERTGIQEEIRRGDISSTECSGGEVDRPPAEPDTSS